MRHAFFLVMGLLVVALFPFMAEAKGVKLTKDQVATVCGQGLQSHGSVTGCKKTCGSNKEHVCEYGCVKGQGCEGDCTTCGDKRTAVFPGFYANRLVKQSVRNAP